jgi:hypothetical protein
MNSRFIGQGFFNAEPGKVIPIPLNHVHQLNKNRRFTMNEQQKNQTEQSGKQIAFGIFGFIVGIILLLYLLKWLLF